MSEVLERKKKKVFPKWIFLGVIPVFFIILYFIFGSSRELADLAVKYFSRPLRDFLGTACSFVPFSVMELMYVALGVFLIVFTVRTVILTVKAEKKLLFLGKRLLIVILIAFYLLAGYLSLWGIDYQSSSFSQREGFVTEGIYVDDLYNATKFFITRASELSGSVKRDENGHFAENMDTYFEQSYYVYDNLEKVFPSLKAESRMPKKMLFSHIMSLTGFTGVYFPYTGESNINIKNPAPFIPSTIAHELAHQRGVYSEQECNFLGVAACVTSGLTVYEYSGYLAGSVYLMNALYGADYNRWQELRSEISGYMLIDWNDNNSYWNSLKSSVTEVSEKIYDVYLKANGQKLGISSYGACVDLLVTYYLGGGFQ